MDFPACIFFDSPQGTESLLAVCGEDLQELRRRTELFVASKDLAEAAPDCRAEPGHLLDEFFLGTPQSRDYRRTQGQRLSATWGAFAVRALRLVADAIGPSFGTPGQRIAAFRMAGRRLSWWVSSRLSQQAGLGSGGFEQLPTKARFDDRQPVPPLGTNIQAEWDAIIKAYEVGAREEQPGHSICSESNSTARDPGPAQPAGAQSPRCEPAPAADVAIELASDFQEFIERIIKERGKTVNQMAEKFGIPKTCLYAAAKGKRKLCPGHRNTLAKGLNIPVENIPA